MKNHHLNRIAASLAVGLALLVVMLGAYTRLSDAGLGCPDWPGCYGRMILPSEGSGLAAAQTNFPEIPIESGKAWTEMIHRYAAGTLAFLIAFMAFRVFYYKLRGERSDGTLPALLMILVIFQAALGMWTVTLKLLPVVVMAHLLGGMLIVACLCRYRVELGSFKGVDLPLWRPWLRIGFCIVLLQIALGGWVSSNYAGIACIGFPTCNGLWMPKLHFSQGFHLWSMPGVNYQGGVLDNEVRASIQYVHRIGALVSATYLLILSILMLMNTKATVIRRLVWFIMLLVALQVSLGILNVVYLLPIFIAVAHNGVAALLLATIFSLLHLTYREAENAR